jgi:hypothetical protein
MSILTPPPTQNKVDGDSSINPIWISWIQLLYNYTNILSNSGPTSNRPTQNLWVGQTYWNTTTSKMDVIVSLSPTVWKSITPV